MGRLFRAAVTRAHRLVGTGLAVALAVGLVSGTFMLTDTISAAFRQASASSKSTPDIEVRAVSGVAPEAPGLPRPVPLPKSLLAKVSAVPGVESLSTTVQGYATLVDRSGQAIAARGRPTLGGGWAAGDSLARGRPPGPGDVVVDFTTARRYQFQPGDKVRIGFRGPAQIFTISGVLSQTSDTAETMAIFDAATAGRVLAPEGQLNEISVLAKGGTSPISLRARISAILPPRDEAVPGAQTTRQSVASWSKSLAFVPTAALLLAGVVLIVGALLIWNTFSLLVGQRSRELGLLRTLGASRAQLRRLVLAEALAVGVSGSLAGVVIGFGAAHGLLAVVRGVGLAVPAGSMVFRARTVAAGFACGVAVTAVAVLLPARRAARVSPMAALNRLDTATRSPGHRAVPAGCTTAAGLALLAAGAGRDLPTLPAIAVGTGAVLIGVALLLPLLAGVTAWAVAAPLVGLCGQSAALARQNVMRNPRRTAATAAALVLAIGLVGVTAIVSASMEASATAAVQRTLRANLEVLPVVTSGTFAGVPPGAVGLLRQIPGVGMVSQIAGGQWSLAGAPERLLAVDPATATQMRQVDAASARAVQSLDDEGVLVRTDVAQRHGWKVGDEIPMTFVMTGTRRVPLRGTFSTTVVPTDYVLSLASFAANYSQPLILEVDVRLAAGASPPREEANVRRALADIPGIEVLDRSQVLATQQAQVARLLMPLAAVLGLAVLIGMLGIANTLALSIHERTDEIGLLRALGMARTQVRAMISCEAVITAGVGSLLGLGLAVVFGWASVTALRHLGLTNLVFPFRQLGLLVAAATGASLLTAILPARRAAGLDILDAGHRS